MVLYLVHVSSNIFYPQFLIWSLSNWFEPCAKQSVSAHMERWRGILMTVIAWANIFCTYPLCRTAQKWRKQSPLIHKTPASSELPGCCDNQSHRYLSRKCRLLLKQKNSLTIMTRITWDHRQRCRGSTIHKVCAVVVRLADMSPLLGASSITVLLQFCYD